MRICKIASELYFSLAQYSMAKNMPEKAVYYLDKASRYSPDYFQIDCHKALYLSLQGRYSDGEEIMASLLKEHTSSPIVYYYAGLCCIESKKNLEAEHYFTSALNVAPENSVMQSYLGLSLLRQGKMKEAFNQIKGICTNIGSEPGAELMYIFEKEVFEAEKKHKPGYRTDMWGDYTKQMRSHPPPRILERGVIFLEGILTRCFMACLFLRKEKKEEKKKLNTGFEKMALKRFEEAASIFKELMDNDSSEASVPEALFYSYLDGGEFEKARETFDFWVREKLHINEPVVENIGNDYELSMNAGRLYFAFEDYKTSLEWFKKAVSIDSKEFMAHYYLGACLLTLGKQKDAIFSFKNALKQMNHNFLLFRFKTWHRSVIAAEQ